MRITKISVTGLFWMFDHEIPLNRDERITIVHGPNGVGKTVLLRMVHGLFNFHYAFISEVPFEQLRIEDDKGGVLTVEKGTEEYYDGASTLQMNYEDETGELHNSYTPNMPGLSDFVKQVAELRSEFVAVIYDGSLFWASGTDAGKEEINPTAGHQESVKHITHMHTNAELLKNNLDILAEVYGKPPRWFERYFFRRTYTIDESLDILLEGVEIEGRLVGRDISTLFTTERLKQDKTIIRELNLHYKLSRTNLPLVYFPSHRMAIKDVESYFDSLLNEDPSLLNEDPEFAFYDEYALSEIEELEKILQEDSVKRSDSAVAAIEAKIQEIADESNLHEYFDQLDLYDGMMEEAKEFCDLVNGRLLFKTIRLADDEDVFWIFADDGRQIPFKVLSSGEQHLCVLYYQLFFEVKPNTLVMIDEPELSLNVVWQRNFIKDLQRIIELRKFDVLIATHSPMVIHDKWDWVVHLGEKVDD